MDAKQGYMLGGQDVKVKRYCQTLNLKDDPKLIQEYIYWHKKENHFPEVQRGIREVGILDMEIYLLGSRLFMIVETPVDFDWDSAFTKLATLDRQAEWEALTGRFQDTLPDATSSEKWKLMERIFKL